MGHKLEEKATILSNLLDPLQGFVESLDVRMLLLFLGVLQQVVEQERDAGQALHRPDHQLVKSLSAAFLINLKFISKMQKNK